MPKRTNTFQQVIAIVTMHMAEGAVVEESAMVVPLRGGTAREVDVLVTSVVGGHVVKVGIEASKRTRKADVGWVEAMKAKHDDLPTDKLVLYSDPGFTRGAAEKATEHGIAAISPLPISEDDLEQRVLYGLRSIWPKLIHLTPQRAKVWVRRPDDTEVWFKAVPDLRLFMSDGSAWSTPLIGGVRTRIGGQWDDIINQIGLRDMAESFDGEFVLGWRPFSAVEDGEEIRLYARNEDSDPPELHLIEAVEVSGRAVIEIEEVDLTHMNLGETHVAYGEVRLGSREAIVVASDGPGHETISLRLSGPAEPSDAR